MFALGNHAKASMAALFNRVHGLTMNVTQWAASYSAGLDTPMLSDLYAGFAYDALYALVLAADLEIRATRSMIDGTSVMQPLNGTSMMQRLLSGFSFNGVMGRVTLDSNGDSMHPWVALNLQNTTFVPVFSYLPLEGVLVTAGLVLMPNFLDGSVFAHICTYVDTYTQHAHEHGKKFLGPMLQKQIQTKTKHKIRSRTPRSV